MFNTNAKIIILLIAISTLVVESQYFSASHVRTYPRIGKRTNLLKKLLKIDESKTNDFFKTLNLSNFNKINDLVDVDDVKTYFKSQMKLLVGLLNDEKVSPDVVDDFLNDLDGFIDYQIFKLQNVIQSTWKNDNNEVNFN
jgi:hypothetical protein